MYFRIMDISLHRQLPYFLGFVALLSLGVALFLAWPSKKSRGTPQLNIFCDTIIPTDHKVPVHVQWRRLRDTFWLSGRIERRGGYSISFPKHAYELDFSEEVAWFDLPADDDWILNANYIDKTFLRHVLAYNLFRAMAPANRAARSVYTRVFLNGNYQGLYVLMQKLDPSSLGLLKTDRDAVIFKEPPVFQPELADFRPQYADNFYQQTYPDHEQSDRAYLMDSLRQFLFRTPDADFRRELALWFDLDNILDWHLLLLLTNNSDGLLKNFYLYRIGGGEPFRIAPWDYDHGLGRDGDNEYNFDRFIDMEKSLLFRRLLSQSWYRTALISRWDQHQRSAVLSLPGLNLRIQALLRQLEQPVAENFRRWPPSAPAYYDANSFAQEVELLLRFLEMRHAQVEQLLREDAD